MKPRHQCSPSWKAYLQGWRPANEPARHYRTPLETGFKKYRVSETANPLPLHLVTSHEPPVDPGETVKPSQLPLVPTVFHEEWWLNATTNGRFSVAEVKAGDKTVGRLPYLVRSRFGLKGIWTPPITYFLGPGIDEGEGSPNTRFLKRMEITRELIAKLPKSSWECIRCHAGTKDVIAFQEQRFRTYVQFTHEIQPAPVDLLWQQMRNKTRNVIRRAKEQISIEQILDPEEFIRAHKSNLAAEGENDSLDMEACQRVLSAALARRQGRILGAAIPKAISLPPISARGTTPPPSTFSVRAAVKPAMALPAF